MDPGSRKSLSDCKAEIHQSVYHQYKDKHRPIHMPEWLYRFGQILPSSSGVEGFIRLQSMGASFSDVLHEVRILWILTIVYGGFAAVGIHLRLKKAAGK